MATYKSGSWKSLPTPPGTPDWRGKAGELLPELRYTSFSDEIENATSPMALWIDIWLEFLNAYEQPRNDDFIRRTYEYADWCLKQPQRPSDGAQDDLTTCVCVCFYESIPSNPAARNDMPRWFTRQEVLDNEVFFHYLIDDEEWQEVLSLWTPGPRHPAKPKKRSR